MKSVLLLFFIIHALLLPAQNQVRLFDSLISFAKKDREQKATSIYYSKVVAFDSALTIGALNELEEIAKKEDDAELQVLQLLFRGEYYFRKWDWPACFILIKHCKLLPKKVYTT